MSGQSATMQPRRVAHQDARPLQVVRFGQQEPVDVTAEEEIQFPQGLVGMPDLRRFVLLDDNRIVPCRWLQSVDDPSLAFVVLNPDLILPDYAAEISDEDARQLQIEDAAAADVWVILTARPDPTESTINLVAPVIVNRKGRLGKQIILDDSQYSIRHPLVAPAESARVPAAAESER